MRRAGAYLPSPSHRYVSGSTHTTLYAVSAIISDEQFIKIGLTQHHDPIRRDPKHYRKTLRSSRVPTEWAWAYETYTLVELQRAGFSLADSRTDYKHTTELFTCDQQSFLLAFDRALEKMDAWHVGRSPHEFINELSILETFRGDLSDSNRQSKLCQALGYHYADMPDDILQEICQLVGVGWQEAALQVWHPWNGKPFPARCNAPNKGNEGWLTQLFKGFLGT